MRKVRLSKTARPPKGKRSSGLPDDRIIPKSGTSGSTSWVWSWSAAVAVGFGIAASLGGLFLVYLALSLSELDVHLLRVRTMVVRAVRQAAPVAAVVTRRPAVLAAPLHLGDTTVAVVVENHVAARPPSGLERAAVVYEAPAEGGITRFVAIFSLGNLPPVIGPVRSIRPYLVDWIEEWQAAVFHSGGSPEALARLRGSSLVDFDEISWNGKYFWRDDARPRPHNLYTSSHLVVQAFVDYRLPTTTTFLPWEVVPDTTLHDRPPDGPAVRIVALDPQYCIAYRYEQSENRYQRWLAGVPHRSAEGMLLYAKGVVVQEVAGKVVDREGRLRLATASGGWARIFSNGKIFPATWQRQDGRTIFLRADGKPMGFPAGPVWVEIVLDHAAVEEPPAAGDPAAVFSLGCGG